MRRLVLLVCCTALAACADSDAATQAERAVGVAGPRRQVVGGVPAAAAAHRPLDGTGTPTIMPVWISPTTLGNSTLRIDANGDLVLKPGAAIIVVNADGTKCYRIGGESIVHAVAGGCPTVWP